MKSRLHAIPQYNTFSSGDFLPHIVSLFFIVSFAVMPLACVPNGPEMSRFEISARVATDVQTANLMPWVERLAAARAVDVSVSYEGFPPENLYPSDHLTRDSAVEIVSEAFASMGYTPTTIVLGEGAHTAFNVVAEWPGTSRASEVVLVASHLDAFYAGADDNGSAVAAMLETARAVRLHRFARTIRFISFDLEELGAVGSTRYVEAGLASDVTAAIVMDLVGYASSKPGSQKGVMGISLPDKGDFLLVIGNEQSAAISQQMVALGNTQGLAKLVGVVAPGDGTYFLSSAFMRSDNGLLWYRHTPTLFLSDGANFRNPNYHLQSDTPETLDPIFLAKNTRALAAAVALFAEVEQ